MKRRKLRQFCEKFGFFVGLVKFGKSSRVHEKISFHNNTNNRTFSVFASLFYNILEVDGWGRRGRGVVEKKK